MKSTTKQRLKLSKRLNEFPETSKLQEYLEDERELNSSFMKQSIDLQNKIRQQNWKIDDLQQTNKAYSTISAVSLTTLVLQSLWYMFK